MELEVGDIVLCTVERIERAIVFVKIHTNGNDLEGSITFSEVSPGRIRNIRDFVVPKKKIVCKVLRIKPTNIDLSLRRVTPKERKEIINRYKQERSYASMIKSVVGEKSKEIIEKISKEDNVFDFFQEAKSNPKKLEEFFSKKDATKISEILSSQKSKKAEIKKEINIKSISSNGLELIKKIFKEINGAEIKYVSAGKYSIKTDAEDIKKASQKLKEILDKIEKSAKKHGMEFSIKEK